MMVIEPKPVRAVLFQMCVLVEEVNNKDRRRVVVVLLTVRDGITRIDVRLSC
jgi:hypothetical protein